MAGRKRERKTGEDGKANKEERKERGKRRRIGGPVKYYR
jgi:hypothetical protein